MKPPATLLAAVLALSVPGCSIPFMHERASIDPGGRVGFGLGTGLRPGASEVSYFTPRTFAPAGGGWGMLYLSYGFSSKFALFAEFSGGAGGWLRRVHHNVNIPAWVDLNLGIKFKLANAWALRANIGTNFLPGLGVQHDFSPSLTGFAWSEVWNGGMGATLHDLLVDADHLSLHAGVSYMELPEVVVPVVALGYSLSFPRGSENGGGFEPWRP